MKTLRSNAFLKFGLAIFALAIAGVLLTPGTPAHANPFYVGSKAKTAVATSTVSYMTPGTATTTFIYDSYEVNGTNETNAGNVTLPDSVALLLQGNASSTATALSVSCEFGDDEINAAGIVSIDWYQNGVISGTTTNSGIQNIGAPNSFSYVFASTSFGGAAVLGNASRFAKVVVCPAPTRYMRAVISVTGANTSVWGAFVPKKQRN